jgi:hypothetical protein
LVHETPDEAPSGDRMVEIIGDHRKKTGESVKAPKIVGLEDIADYYSLFSMDPSRATE